MLYAIDPGLRHCGFAMFADHGVLIDARLLKSPCGTAVRGPPAWRAMADEVKHATQLGSRLIIEVPRIYPHSGQRKGDLNDLLELAGVVGVITGVFDVLSFVYPADWKGQVPKKVMNERTLAALDEYEIQRVKHRDDNTVDAVGIGLHHFGRLNKKRIFR